MKTLALTLAMLCLCVYYAAAQDTLLLKNGDELHVKVEKIDEATITYTMPPVSVVYTKNKADVFMVKFASGTKYVIGNASEAKEMRRREIDEAIKQKSAAYNYERYKKSYTKRKVSGIVLLSIGGAFATTGITLICEGIRIDRKEYAYHQSLNQYPKSEWYPQQGIWMQVGGGILTGASFPFLLIGTINMSLTPKYKRKMNEAKQQLSFYPTTQPLQPVGNIGSSYTGIAMRINF